jgi:hypothetical protein
VLARFDVGGLILWLCNQLVHTSSRATEPKELTDAYDLNPGITRAVLWPKSKQRALVF